ncbi:hypothetical protein LXL04_022038 [Taraxacum kok-saghyz]
METEETGFNSEIKAKAVEIFSQFMTRIAKFEELVAVGNRFLEIFRQRLDFIRRPSIDDTSELLKNVIKANNTERMQSYIKSGYTHSSDRTENLNKLNYVWTFDDYFCLWLCAYRTEVHKSHIQLLEIASKAKYIIKELERLVEDLNLAIQSPDSEEVINYATIVASVYSMVKKDYLMQEKIVDALSVKTSSGELETYCLMWSLRPFVNDEIMQQAWRLIP